MLLAVVLFSLVEGVTAVVGLAGVGGVNDEERIFAD